MEDSDEEDGDEDEDEDEDDEVCFRLADNLRTKNTLATTDYVFQVAVKAWRALCGYHHSTLACHTEHLQILIDLRFAMADQPAICGAARTLRL